MITKEALEHLTVEIRQHPDYAWAWHCNIAMPIHDSGVDITLANKAAVRVMEHLFGRNTSDLVKQYRGE